MSAPLSLLRLLQRPVATAAGRQLLTIVPHQACIATRAYRVPNTLQRGYFWQRKAPELPVAEKSEGATSQTTVRSVKEVESEPAATTPVEETPKTKAARLGFSLTDLASHVSWAHVKTYAVYASIGGGMILVFKGGMNVLDFFATLNFLDIGEVAFITGLLSGFGLVACGWAGTRFLRLRPEPIYQHALRRLNNDAIVRQYMGHTIEAGSFRAYSFVPGTLRMTQEQRQKAAAATGIAKYWQPKRLQMFFQVQGSNGVVGMASTEVEKSWQGDHSFNLLSVELTETGERIVLEGDANYQIYKGIIKLR